MKKDCYIESLLSQIREKRAKEQIRKEISSHIEDQKSNYITDGMTAEDAEEKAVMDMGDPIETGMALDRIHRPKPAWRMLAVIAMLCAVGVLLQYAVYAEGLSSRMGSYYLKKQCMYGLAGFFMICIVYLIDYTRIAKYSRYLCSGILLYLFLLESNAASFLNLPFIPHYELIGIFGHWIGIGVLFYLYLPLYGAVLHSYRNCTVQHIWKVILYTFLPIFFAFRLTHLSTRINVFIIIALIFCTAAIKGWLPMKAKKSDQTSYLKYLPHTGRFFHRKGILLILTALLAAAALLFIRMPSYQMHRIQAWLHPGAYKSTIGYTTNLLRKIIRSSQLIGKHTDPTLTIFPNIETDFLLTYAIGTFGILAGATLITLIVLLGIKLLNISIHQKNQLGMIMGLGCSLVFLIQSVEYILVNLTLLPESGLYLPLVSFGGSGMLQTCMLLGIMLSIYRYENVVSEPQPVQTENTCFLQAKP